MGITDFCTVYPGSCYRKNQQLRIVSDAALVQFSLHSLTQTYSLPAASEAISEAADSSNARVHVVTKHPVNAIRVKVGSADEQVGKSFAVVAAVIVEHQVWGLSESVCFCGDFVAGVDSVPEGWNLVAKKN